MLEDHVEAVFENGVFRPLEPVDLPEHQRVTVSLPADVPMEDDVPYAPLPFLESKTIRVKVKIVGALAPMPYPIEPDPEQE